MIVNIVNNIVTSIQSAKTVFLNIASDGLLTLFRKRVISDGGDFEAQECASSGLFELGTFLGSAQLLLLSNAFKTGKIYLVKSTFGDLAFTRSTVANRINESDTMEALAINEPKLDYLLSDCPVLRFEPTRTNLFLNSASLSTQGVTTTAQVYTVTFFGTGTITFSGAHTGSLVGTGANERVQTTFTPSAGTVTCTATGDVNFANFEAGAYPTSWITTLVTTVQRTFDRLTDFDITSLINGEGTLFVEFLEETNATSRQISLSNNSATERITFSFGSNSVSLSVLDGSSQITSAFSSLVNNQKHKIAVTFKENKITYHVDSNLITRGSVTGTYSIPTISTLGFSRNGGSLTGLFYGNILKLGVSNRALYEEEANLLTSYNPPKSQSTFDIDTDFDLINLQTNNADDFTLSGNEVTQWDSRSGSILSAVQSTSANRPLYNNGLITFDGVNDFLELSTEIDRNVFTIYLIVKASAVPTVAEALLGGVTNDDFISMRTQADVSRFINMNNLASSGLNKDFTLWGEEYYQVLSIRKSTTTLYLECNGRELIERTDNDSNTVNFKLGYIARSLGGNYFGGIIRAFCAHTTYLSQLDNDKIINDLYNRYNLPENSTSIVGFGDSITQGSNSSNRLTTAWLPTLASDLSLTFKNYGIGGTAMCDVLTGGIERWKNQIVEPRYQDIICILYGTNDVSTYTPQQFEYCYETVLNGLILSGYNAKNIVIGTVPYREGDALATEIAAYNVVINELATRFQLKGVANVYEDMKNGGGDAIMDDTVHPNDAGHVIIANAFKSVMQ